MIIINCNFKTVRSLTSMERSKLQKELEAYSQKYFIENKAKIELQTILATLKVFVICCNRTLGMGEKRISKIFDEIITTINKESLTDEIFETHLDKECKQILGEETFKKYFFGSKNDTDIKEK